MERKTAFIIKYNKREWLLFASMPLLSFLLRLLSLFKIPGMHILFSFWFLLVLCIAIYLATKKQHFIFRSILIALSVGNLGSLFLIQHYPGATVLFLIYSAGIIALFVSLLWAAIKDRHKDTEMSMIFIVLGILNLIGMIIPANAVLLYLIPALFNAYLIGNIIINRQELPLSFGYVLTFLFIMSLSNILALPLMIIRPI